MSYQITIIGLGEIGTSLGLALNYHKDQLFRVGTDTRKSAEKNAENCGAVDKIIHNLSDAIKEADIVFLALPSKSVKDVMEWIGKEVREGCVVIDSCPTKTAAAGWAKEFLADPTHYVSVYPALNPDVLSVPGNSYNSAKEELFKNGTFYIAAAPNTESTVVKLAVDLANLVGSYSSFCDMAELDSLIASSMTMPAVISNAIFNTAYKQNSWRETAKLGGKVFFQMTRPEHSGAVDPSPEMMLQNRENTVRMLNEFILSLKEYRDALQNNDEASLRNLLENTKEKREKWFDAYVAKEWRHEASEKHEQMSAGEIFGQMFLGGLSRRKKS